MENLLLSSQKSSDSGLQAVLHPLVLLTISDYITRHTLRKQKGPIVGALLGQQNGREITIEHAFECAMVEHNEEVILDAEWFKARLEQMRLIHKSPQLDLAGWYTVFPKTGPTPAILPIHNFILSEYNESSMLLAVHPEEAVSQTVGSKLPLTIYESNWEIDEPKADQAGDKEMRDGDAPLKLKFRELPYSVETGEAEMISMDFVARGAGNATAVEAKTPKKSTPVPVDTNNKGKRRVFAEDLKDEEISADEHILSREDEELIASLTAKANAVKMLQSRINLLVAYLRQLPPSAADQATNTNSLTSYTILRSIQALVNRLGLIVPAEAVAFEQEMLSEANDVNLMSLLNDVMQSVTEVRDIGKKHNAVDSSKASIKKGLGDSIGPGGSFSMLGPGDLSI